MALGTCERCSTRLRLGSRTCTRCGTKKKRAKYLFIAVIFVECAVIGQHLALPKGGMVQVASAHEVPAPLLNSGGVAPAGWLYYQTVDEMIDDTTRHARVLSRSDPAAGSAGDHGSVGVLELRASPAYGRSVVITLSRHAADAVAETCELRARFDAGEEAVFQASGSADPLHATLVIADTGGFVSRLASARTLALEAKLSPKAERVAMFDVSGLKWR